MPCGYYNSTGLPYNHQPHFPKGNVPVNKGKKGLLKQTESAKDKIRQYQKGRKKSLAARINMICMVILREGQGKRLKKCRKF